MKLVPRQVKTLMRYVPVKLLKTLSVYISLPLYEIQAFTMLATNCIKKYSLPKLTKIRHYRSRAAALEKENMRMASQIKQLRKDKKALHTQEMSMYKHYCMLSRITIPTNFTSAYHLCFRC